MSLPHATGLPHWPRRMQADLAAAYCGVSTTKFRAGVAEGRYPQPYPDGGNRLWYREDLDEALDALKAATFELADPFSAALRR